jgi:tRNA A37 N6-isopentenylltransferase MiaA
MMGYTCLYMNGKNLTNEEKLEAIYEMTYENHQMLRTIRRQQYFANTFRVVYWLVILGFVGGSYYYIRPLIVGLSGDKGRFEETLNQFNQLRSQLPETKLVNQMMNSLKAKQASSTDSQMIDDGVLDEVSTTTP